MAFTEKYLWVINYDSLTDFLDRARSVGATAAVIRTDNDLSKAIPLFHAYDIKVVGWRWPASKRDPAICEANAADKLFALGLDGYFVDPEGEPGQPYDWDQNDLAPLAQEFCSIVKGNSNRLFGVTSHYQASAKYPKLPWSTFFASADVLLPQAYWETDDGKVGHGIPEDNYEKSFAFWTAAGGDTEKIQPMAGELVHVTADEIDRYVAAAANQGVSSLHFYSYDEGVAESTWDAVAKAQVGTA